METIQGTLDETQKQTSQQQPKKQDVIPKKSHTINLISAEMTPSVECTVEDINKWFNNQKIPDDLVKLFDFQSLSEIHRYAAKLRIDPKAEFLKYSERYAKLHAGEELEEYIFDRFKDALLSLTNKYPETLKASMPPEQSSTPKSIFCTIL